MIALNPKKILIARGDVLGDVTVTSALITPLKKQFPNAKIYFLIRQDYMCLFNDDPQVDGCIVDPLPYTCTKKDRPNMQALSHTLKAHQFDCFIGCWETPRYAYIAWKAGIPIRIGHAKFALNKLFYTHAIKLDYNNMTLHKCQYNAKLLGPLGITDADQYPVQLHSHQTPFITLPYIAIHLDAGTQTRIMLDAHFIGMVQYIALHFPQYKMVLFGLNRNKNSAINIVKACSHIRLTNDVGRGDLSHVMGLIKHASLVISADSGPAHIAAGFNVPVVVNYVNRIQNACHWGPWRVPHRIVSSVHNCIDVCHPNECVKTTCRDGISQTQLHQAINDLLNQAPLPSPNQQHYWLKHTLTIGVFDSTPDALKTYLNQEGWRTVVLPNASHIFDKKRCDANINIILLPTAKKGWLTALKWAISNRWASNYITFLPQTIYANTGFQLELELTSLFNT